MTTILELRGISKRFGGVQALVDVSFSVAPGEIVGLLGPNGAGKTTLFNVIAGLFPPTIGTVLFAGVDIGKLSADRRCKKGISRTFQLMHPFNSMTVLENITVGALVRSQTIATATEDARNILDSVGLEGMGEKYPGELSVIEAKRLELARAMAARPQLLLLDEISNGLRSDELEILFATIDSLREQGVTMIVIEHNMEALRYMCDRVVAIDSGTVLLVGTPEQVLSDQRVVETYLGGVVHA